MARDLSIKVPSLFIVSHDSRHRHELEEALSPEFKLSVYGDASAAAADLHENAPSVVIAENDIPPKGGIHELAQQSAVVNNGTSILLTKSSEGRDRIDFENLGIRGRTLTWPFPASLLKRKIAELINENAEHEWEALPETQKRALTLTVAEYQGIADKIASGEPLQYSEAAQSCEPLVEAVNQGGHYDLLKSVQSHHNYTYVHSMRVATLLTMFGHGIGMRGDDLLILSTGGLLHDVGKMVTPPQILDKPGKLTEEEWPIMRDHVLESSNLLSTGDDMTKGAKIIAEQHHEKLDGTGYPKGLAGRELNELARMSAIVDIFGALTDERSYKPPFPPAKAFEILESMTTAIDQNLLVIFKDIFGGDASSGL